MTDPNALFAGSIPAAYDRYLGPLFFEPYAADLSARVATGDPVAVLEIACGSGIVTRALLGALPHATIIATDLNESMIEHAQTMVPASFAAFLATGRCERAALRRCQLRYRRHAVRDHVRSRQGPGLP